MTVSFQLSLLNFGEPCVHRNTRLLRNCQRASGQALDSHSSTYVGMNRKATSTSVSDAALQHLARREVNMQEAVRTTLIIWLKVLIVIYERSFDGLL